jgi:hypothetical protein
MNQIAGYGTEGYYDESGNWVAGTGDIGGYEQNIGTEGYYDESGNWVEPTGMYASKIYDLGTGSNVYEQAERDVYGDMFDDWMASYYYMLNNPATEGGFTDVF